MVLAIASFMKIISDLNEVLHSTTKSRKSSEMEY